MSYTTNNPHDFDWFQNFTNPIRHKKNCAVVVGVILSNFFGVKYHVLLPFFLMSLAISGNDFFNLYDQAKNRVCTSKIESNRPFLLN